MKPSRRPRSRSSMSLRASIDDVLDGKGCMPAANRTAGGYVNIRTARWDSSRIIRSLTYLISSGAPRATGRGARAFAQARVIVASVLANAVMSARRRNSARSVSATCRAGPEAASVSSSNFEPDVAKSDRRLLVDAGVPRKSRSPSAATLPERNSIPSEVATAFSVTPAQATRASSSMSPEQSSAPLPRSLDEGRRRRAPVPSRPCRR